MKGLIQLLLGIVIGLVLVSLIGGAYLFGKRSNKTNNAVDLPLIVNTITPQVTPTPTQTIQNDKLSYGSLGGSLSYPSEGIPENLEVCAEHINTKEKFCTTSKLKDKKYTYGVGYQLEVPAGVYHVYVFLPVNTSYKAYYSKAVLCGLSVNCTDHTPIVVKIDSNEIIDEVNPQDWYVQN